MNHAVDRPPFFIVLNAASGSSDAAATRDVIEGVLSEAGRAHDLRVVENPAELAETARAVVAQAVARRGVVVVAGGDGTITTVAHAAHRARQARRVRG